MYHYDEKEKKMIIDAHAHIYEYLRPYGPWGEGRAIGKGKIRWPDGIEMQFFPPEYGDTGFPAESLLSVMKENGVDKAVLMQAQNYGFQNDYVAEVVKKYPDRFVGACTFDPYGRKAMELFRHFAEVKEFRILKFELSECWGLSGIHPDLSLDSAIFLPVWEYAEKNHIIIAFDPGFYGRLFYMTRLGQFASHLVEKVVDAFLNLCSRCPFVYRLFHDKPEFPFFRRMSLHFCPFSRHDGIL